MLSRTRLQIQNACAKELCAMIEGCDTEAHRAAAAPGQIRQDVRISNDQGPFGDESDRVGVIGESLKALACELVTSFDGLVWICCRSNCDLVTHPGSSPELLPENMRQVGLDKDHAFKFICI